MQASWNYSYVLCLRSYAPCLSSRGVLLMNDLTSFFSNKLLALSFYMYGCQSLFWRHVSLRTLALVLMARTSQNKRAYLYIVYLIQN